MPSVRGRRPNASPHIVPRDTPPRSTNDLRPHFSLYSLEDGFRVSDCETAHKGGFAERLQELSQLTWNQIVLAPRQGLGSETIARDSIHVPVPRQITPDTRILAFRFGGGARIIGYREDRVFHVVWIDPHHRVYRG